MWCGDTVPSLHRQYYWYDERGKKIKCTAPQYVDFVMSSVQKLVTDEDVFPTKYGMAASWGSLGVPSVKLVFICVNTRQLSHFCLMGFSLGFLHIVFFLCMFLL